jgi:hypothetical protein
MDKFDYMPFVYDDYDCSVSSGIDSTSTKKMYNRGHIMSTDECRELNDWASKLYADGKLRPLVDNRFELKLYHDNKDVIPLVFDIKKRIECRENLSSFKSELYVKDFLAVVPLNGVIHCHTDPNDFENNLFHVRFNVFINTPPNNTGTTYYNGVVVETVNGSYVLCRSGIDEHWSDPNTSDVPRISLSFGYLLPAEKVDELTSDTSVGTYKSHYPLALQNIGQLSISFNEIPRIIELQERGEKGSCIYTAANIFTNQQCDFLISYIENNSRLLTEKPIEYGNNVECKFIVLDEMRTMNIPYSTIIDKFIFNAVGKLLVRLRDIQCLFKGMHDDGYTLRKIIGKTKLHTDGITSKYKGSKDYVRCLSLIIVLNDDYDGGVFCFPNHGVKFRVQRGEAIMFPPYWTHPHSVTSVGEQQSRYTINTWIWEKF